jgi:hypothetical protein
MDFTAMESFSIMLESCFGEVGADGNPVEGELTAPGAGVAAGVSGTVSTTVGALPGSCRAFGKGATPQVES